jgi:DNA invertase Pin-like site-specific DNA recombinase
MNTSHNKFFLYARKSTDEPGRQIRSIHDQLEEMRQLARERGFEILDVLIEKQSAKNPGRPIFRQMLDRIERGEASGILAWHPDRLARNSLDGGRVIYLLDTGRIEQLVFKDSTVEPTSHGKLMLGISFGMSKYHSDNFSDGIKRLYRRKIADGLWPHRPPIGYLFDPQTHGIKPDPDRAPFVRRAFELYAAGGHSLTRLTREINALGLRNRPRRHETIGPPPNVAQYQHILKNPIYFGVMSIGNELFPGKHEPLVSKPLFDAAQEMLTCRSKPNQPSPVSCLYRGTFKCGECGASITSEIQRGHEYLRCTKKLHPCSQPYLRIERVHELIEQQLSRFALPDSLADSLITQLKDELKDRDRAQSETCTILQAKINDIDHRLQRLLKLHLDETISLEEYRLQKNALIAQRRQIEDQLIHIETTGTSWLEPAIAFIQGLKSTVFSQSLQSIEQKRDFLKKVGSNLIIRDRIIELVPRQPWKTVVDSHGFCSLVGGAGSGAAAPADVGDLSENLCPEWDKVRTYFRDSPQGNGPAARLLGLPIPLPL